MQETNLTLTIGERLLIARRRAGINSTEMARVLRVAPNTIRSWETDRTAPHYLALLAWADACDVAAELIEPDIKSRCSQRAAGDAAVAS